MSSWDAIKGKGSNQAKSFHRNKIPKSQISREKPPVDMNTRPTQSARHSVRVI